MEILESHNRWCNSTCSRAKQLHFSAADRKMINICGTLFRGLEKIQDVCDHRAEKRDPVTKPRTFVTGHDE